MFILMIRGDDEPTIHTCATQEALDRLLEEFTDGDRERYKYLSEPPQYSGFPSYSICIISGQVVKPVPKEVVTVKSWKYE